MNPKKDAPSLHHSADMVVKSFKEFLQEFQQDPGTQFRDHEDQTILFTGVPHPILNAVLQTNLESESLDDEIQNSIRIFKDKAVPFSWYIWPNSSPENLAEGLEANGLTPSSSSPNMIADLSRLPKEVTWAEGLEIKLVVNDSMMADWLIPINQAFQLPVSVGDFFINVYTTIGLDETKPTRHYVAYLEGKPVASSTIYLGSDRVAGIWNVATTAESRGKGIGTAVTWKPLQMAVKEGYTHAILRSTEMGYNVYQRLGFEEAFKDKFFVWQPPEE